MPILTFKQGDVILWSRIAEEVTSEEADEASLKFDGMNLKSIEFILHDGATVDKCTTLEDIVEGDLLKEVFYNLV